MSTKWKVILIISIIFLIASCVLFFVFGVPGIAHQIDNIIAAGPGSTITAILGLLLSFYCIPPVIVVVIFLVIVWLSIKFG